MMYATCLKNLRNINGKSQSDIALILNITRSTYSDYEKEYQIIPIKHLVTLTNYYNVSLDYVFSYTNVKNYNFSLAEIDKVKSGLRIKQFRKSIKYTQKRLAATINTVAQVISKYEKGVNLIATPFLYEICIKYNVSADYLLGRIDYIPDWCNKSLKNE